MGQLTGFFHLTMRAEDKELIAIAEIHPPGLASERLVHILRCEWAERLVPGVSQNRIECLGWEPIACAPAGWQPSKGGSSNPVTIWRPPSTPNEHNL